MLYIKLLKQIFISSPLYLLAVGLIQIGRIYFLLAASLLLLTVDLSAQNNGVIHGKIFNKKNNEPIPFANIVLWNTIIGSTSDIDGNYRITGIKPGYIELRVSSVGFKTYISESILITNANPATLDILLEETSLEIGEVVVKASPFRRSQESPLSLRRINIDEIEKNPGGNRDISKIIQSLPGVASTPAYRNDVIVRGGGTGENRFYLDGVEIPNINHFATQGASGGPVGIINVDFIREVNFYSGAFPTSKGNALSSVLDFKQVEGNMDGLKVKGALGASDLALTLDGPLSKGSNFIFSARRSYLQYLFNALGLPFLPTYNDFQFKLHSNLSSKNELTIIGLGAIDQFSLNTGLKNPTEYQRYILSGVPVYTQWNYTLGVVYKHYRKNGYDTWVMSRNMLNNRQYKYQDNIESNPKLLDYTSQEAENEFRYERDISAKNELNINFGTGLEYAHYTNSTYRALFNAGTLSPISYNTNLDLFKWNVFGQVSKSYFDQKLDLSLGVRADANNYSSQMNNLLKQFSPRFSLSYQFSSGYYFNFNTGIYYQQPPYTTLGFGNSAGELVNKNNNLSYIRSNHYVAGIDWSPNQGSKITFEGFFKLYHGYPFSIRDSISLASKGADFGTFGDEAVLSIGKGRAYGVEFLYRSKDLLGFNIIAAYTLVWSQSNRMDKNLKSTNSFIPTAWDNRNLFTLTATRVMGRNWNIGFKWRFIGGAPYTPYDLSKSSLIAAWDVQPGGYLDYSKYNSKRLKPFHQLDVRIDKMYYLKKWTLNFYVDIQNLYNFKADEASLITTVVDQNQNPVVDPLDSSRYLLKKVDDQGSTSILPTIGVIVEF
ncbi:MAG: TonB-dependent receptor [Bacteroidales bacterium]|nr:TonB-dependent receptor [Bacteroidales bacterium]